MTTHPHEYQAKRTAAVDALLKNPEFLSACKVLRNASTPLRIVNRRQARKYLQGRGAVRIAEGRARWVTPTDHKKLRVVGTRTETFGPDHGKVKTVTGTINFGRHEDVVDDALAEEMGEAPTETYLGFSPKNEAKYFAPVESKGGILIPSEIAAGMIADVKAGR